MKLLIALLVAISMQVGVSAAELDPNEIFFTKAAEVGQAAIAAGRLAQSKAIQPSVREFGAMMVKEHSMANSKIKKMASLNGVTLSDELSVQHRAQQIVLADKEGRAFDQAYIETQIRDHENTISFLEAEIAVGKGHFSRGFAQAVLPKVRKHLDALKTLQADNISTSQGFAVER